MYSKIGRESKIRFLGRNGGCGLHAIDEAGKPILGDSDSPLALFWTGSGLLIYGALSELWIDLESDYDIYESWISWSVNGETVGRVMVEKGRSKICLFRGMNQDTPKMVRILKETQAMSGDGNHTLLVHGIEYQGTILDLPEPKLRLEFIGDSITSGEGSIGARCEEDWVSMIFSAFHDYAVLTADLCEADYRIVSQSGWGTYVSWDNHPEYTIPPFYEQVCGLLWGEPNVAKGAKMKYDFSSWQPDCIISNLGTNDCGAFDSPAFVDPVSGECYKMEKNPDGSYNEECVSKIKDAIKGFCKKLRKNNPKAHILWVNGMLGANLASAYEDAINEYKAENADENAAFLVLPDSVDEYIGARFHPGILAHQRAASILFEYISQKFNSSRE